MNASSKSLIRSIFTKSACIRHISRQCIGKSLSTSACTRHQTSGSDPKQQQQQQQNQQQEPIQTNEQNNYTHFGFKTIPEEMKESLGTYALIAALQHVL
jgi:hypothetical protein